MSDKRTIVLKFGGSVLRDEADLPLAVHEIYRHWRQGYRVLAVVSAFEGTTDELLSRTEKYGPDGNDHAVATLLATGEAVSAALLSSALKRSGIHSKILAPHQVAILTEGDPLDGEITGANIQAVDQALDDSIVIVSGFVGVNADGDTTLLGRGGTDLTALYLANELSARCVLVKDVDGLFESNPADATTRPRRFSTVSYKTTLERGGELVQPKAVEFAAKAGLDFEIASLGSGVATFVGGYEDTFASDITEDLRRPLKVALLGCGVVGFGVYERLRAMPQKFEITGVVNLRRERAIERGIEPGLIRSDAIELIEDDCDVVVELIGGKDAAHKFIRHALASGKAVVSANKALISENDTDLHKLADSADVSLRYSAAVGGVVPALETARRLARTSRPTAIRGIINGTSNFICGRLEDGEGFADSIKAAQAAGFAEADPTLDIDGSDAAQKLVLLARTAFGSDIDFDDIARRGLEAESEEEALAAKNAGRSYRVVAEFRSRGKDVIGTVSTVSLDMSDPLANVHGAENLLEFETEGGIRHVVRGRGAGRYATAEAVLGDIFDIYYETIERSRPVLAVQPDVSCRVQGAAI
ncbi:MAG TPA: homoserine dehydrogenase [Pyrinomonadaceae bacterium]|nr:homoserine dehydrogenase [Pyrinomonadaceae bacterium]